MAAAAVPLLALAACSASSSGSVTATSGSAGPAASSAAGEPSATGAAAGDGKTVKDMCPAKPTRVAHIDGFGGNTWRKTTHAELLDEVSACKDITVDYTDAGGDLQKYISAINSSSAKGYDIIITFDDFGSQALSALTSAKRNGAVVAIYVADAQGKLGQDYDVFVPYGFQNEGKYMADWLAKQVKPGKNNLLFTGGLAGGSVPTVALMNFVKEQNTANGNALNFLVDKPIPSGWDPATMQKAMAGALAKYPQIDAYASDYGVADIGAIRAYLASGRQLPPWATSAGDNELGCLWLENRDKQPNWQLLQMEGTTSTVRVTMRKAVAKLNGTPDTFPNVQELIPFVDTVNGKLPTCNKDFPPDADLSANLTQGQLKQVFGG
jgi:ribose transport system substrate-binding protein